MGTTGQQSSFLRHSRILLCLTLVMVAPGGDWFASHVGVLAWPLFIEPQGGVSVRSAYNGSIHLAPGSGGNVKVSSSIQIGESDNLEFGEAGVTLNSVSVSELLSLRATVAELASTVATQQQNLTTLTTQQQPLATNNTQQSEVLSLRATVAELASTVLELASTVATQQQNLTTLATQQQPLATNNAQQSELVSYRVASGSHVQNGSAVSYVLTATGDLEVTNYYPEISFQPLVDVEHVQIVALTSSLYIIVYQDPSNQNYGTVLAAEVSSFGKITLSDPPEVFAAEGIHYIKATRLSDTSFVVIYNGQAAEGTFLPSMSFEYRTFSWSNKVAFIPSTSTASYHMESVKVVAMSATKFVVAFTELVLPYATATAGKAYIGTTAGSSIAFSAAQTFDTLDGSYLYDLIAVSTAEFIVAFRENTTAGVCKIGTVAGSGSTASATFSSRFEFDTALLERDVAVTKLTSSTAVVAYRDMGDQSSGVCRILTISGASLSFSTEFDFAVEVHKMVAITALDESTFVLAFQRSPSNPSITAVTGTVNAVYKTVVFSPPYAFQEISSLDTRSGNTHVVSVLGGFMNVWFKDTEGMLLRPRNLGIVAEMELVGSINATAHVTVAGAAQVFNKVLSPGVFYYSTSSGNLTSEITSFPVGLATSTSQLLIQSNRHQPKTDPAGQDGDHASGGGFLTGEIRSFGGTLIPDGWLECDGDTLARTQYPDLFHIIGTTWGASPTNSTFKLPDLRGRTLVGRGKSASLSARTLGVSAGAENHTLTAAEIPAHTHTVTTSGSCSGTASGSYSGYCKGTQTATTNSIGGGTSHSNMQPYSVVVYIIKS